MLDDDDDDAEGEPDVEVNGTAHTSIRARAVSTKGAIFKPMQPLSPPNSTSSVANNNHEGFIEHRNQELAPPAVVPDDPWARGGLPWYLGLFDIDGTTVHEERWSGRDAMSEELTDLDEEELAVLRDKPNASVEADAKSKRRISARIKRAEENSTTSNEEQTTPAEVQQTEEEIAERVRKDKANARRRAQRRRR
jgi:NuA3 HAT complex component NTO1